MIRTWRDKRATAPLSGGEANVGSNVGSAGVGPYKQKTGSTLELYKANGTEGISIALDGTDKIDHKLNIPGLNSLAPNNIAADLVAFYLASASVHKKMSVKAFWDKVFNYYLTTQGDMIYQGLLGLVPTRLPIGTAGQFLRVNSGATAPAWSTIQDARVYQIQDPTATDDGLMCGLFPQACTLKNVIYQVSGGTNVVFNLEINAAPFGGGTSNVFAGDKTATTTEQNENDFTGGDATIAAHDVLKINITSVSGSVDWLFVGVEFEVDA